MMSLLLDEVALAALRLADAGVESPRTDAELIAASVHNVRRGELHTVPDADSTRGSGPRSPAAPPASRFSTSPAAPTSAISSSKWGRECSCRARRPR
jgi:hypothetical protein